MDKCVDYFRKAEVFSSLSANSGYWKVKVEEIDRDKMAFTSHRGLYCFLRMRFALLNASRPFQSAMYVIFLAFKWQFAPEFLDEIVVFSRSTRNNIEHLWRILPF